MFSAGNSLCMCVREYTEALFTACNHTLPFSHCFLTHLCTGTNVNVSPTIPPFSARFPSLSFSPSCSPSLPFAPSPPRNLPQALHLSGLSACFFIWLVATGGSTLADYNSAASHFRFIRAPSLCAPTPTSASHTHYPHQHQSRHIAIPHHPTTQHTSTFLLFPPTFHTFLFRSAWKI